MQGLFLSTQTALRQQARLGLRRTGFYTALLVLVVAGAGFMVAAVFLWLQQAVPTPLAAALTGALLLLAALGAYAVARARRTRDASAPDPAAALTSDLAAAVRQHPMEAVLLALTTGMSAGARQPQ